MVVFLLIILVITPPRVSIPNERGVTSSKRRSLTSPLRTPKKIIIIYVKSNRIFWFIYSLPPWIAAPMATASSGLTLLLGTFPKNLLTNS